MITSLPPERLARYVARQLENHFPDDDPITPDRVSAAMGPALERVEFCFRHIQNPHFFRDGSARLDHLFSDQYAQFLCYLANAAWKERGDEPLAKKIFYLNKAMHAVNCVYDTAIPDIWWLIHAVGAVIGKARYSNYLVVRQNCTIGAIRGEYPEIGEGLILSAGAMVVGRCRIGDNVMLGPGCVVMNQDIPDNVLVRASTAVETKPNSGRAFDVHFRRLPA